MKSFSKNTIYQEISKEIDISPNNALDMINNIEKDFTDMSYIALLIRILCLNNMWMEAYEIYKNIPINLRKKRFIIPILKKISEISIESAFNFFKLEILNKFIISEEDIKIIYNRNNFVEVFDIISKNHIVMKDNIFSNDSLLKLSGICCKSCNSNLKKVYMEKNLNEVLLNNIQKFYFCNNYEELNKLNNKIYSKNYDIFIDGNNILFFKDRKVIEESFERLNNIYKTLLNLNLKPLIFLHRRHKNSSISNLPIYYTPYKMNDDWFFLWSSLKKQGTYLLTNDNLKDHIFKIANNDILLNEINNWFDTHVINYKYKDDYKLIFPKKYSKIAQVNKGCYHIPFENNKWLCFKYE